MPVVAMMPAAVMTPASAAATVVLTAIDVNEISFFMERPPLFQ